MEMNLRSGIAVFAAALVVSAGLVAGGFFIGNGFYQSRMADRTVTVKGVSERYVSADLAVWNIKIAVTGDVLADIQQTIEGQKAELTGFLKGNGVKPEDIQNEQLSVTDLLAQQWRSDKIDRNRFIVNYSLTVRTNDVANLKAVSGRTGELIKKGLVLADDSGPSYIFTKLNDIKPEMIAEATKNARKAAEQFAADSGSKVGSIRRAYQGVFDIQAANQTASDDSDGMSGGSQASQIDKKVRVVSTIDYSLVN
jgi:hypothetical protein